MTGSYWDVTIPEKPTGKLDPQDARIIPYDFSSWLEAEGTTYASHTITHGPEMSASDVSVIGGVIRIKVSATDQAMVGGKYGVTVQIYAADTQKISQTLYFKIKDR